MEKEVIDGYDGYDGWDYYDDEGYYVNGGGGAYDWGFDTGAEYGDSGYSPGGAIDYAPYEQQWGLELPTLEPIPDSSFGGSDLFGAYYDYYFGAGLDPLQALNFAAEDAAGGSIQSFTEAQAPTPTLPEDSFPFYGLPYVPNYDYWQSSPYVPTFPDLPAPSPPVSQSPATRQPNLPPACPGGQYHPYPIGHPQQNICVPFPVSQSPAPSPISAGKPPSPIQQPPKPSQQSKPPQQPQQTGCPTGYYRNPQMGQCQPIPRCTTPGTVFDAARGICVPRNQAVSPLPGEAGDLLSNLKNLPWWVWAAGLGALLLLGKDDDGRTTTVRYRRAN